MHPGLLCTGALGGSQFSLMLQVRKRGSAEKPGVCRETRGAQTAGSRGEREPRQEAVAPALKHLQGPQAGLGVRAKGHKVDVGALEEAAQGLASEPRNQTAPAPGVSGQGVGAAVAAGGLAPCSRAKGRLLHSAPWTGPVPPLKGGGY